MDKTVHEQLTELLMDAGCTISKPAIDKLVRWVYVRDNSLIEGIHSQADRMKKTALYQYGLDPGTLQKDGQGE